MSLVLFLVRSSRALLASALAASIVSGFGVSLLVALINGSIAAPAAELPRLGLQFAGLSVGMLVFRWLSQSLFVRLSQSTLAQLRLLVSRHIAEAPFREIEKQGAGRLLAVLTADIATVAEFFWVLPRLLVHGVVILGCLGYLAYLSPAAFGGSLLLGVLGSLAHYGARRRGNQALARARLGEDDVFRHFRALFDGAKELKQHRARREAFLDDVLGRSVDHVRSERARGLSIYAGAASWRALVFFLVIGFVIFVLSANMPIAGEVRSGFALMLLYMMLPVHALLEATPALGRTRVALERIESLGVRPTWAADVEAPLPAAEPLRSLKLQRASYSYRRDDGAAFTLGPLSLDFGPGEIVFLVGGNGSGKTTLAKLLVGLYEPEAGEILLNGRRIERVDLEVYRQCFACVFLDFHLFGSLLGMAGPSIDARARQLLKALVLEHKVTIQEGVFSTTELSSGQQKRLALLVACLEDRPFYVFDEWAADQDPTYKEVFYRQILPELKARGKTVLVVTHDDRYFPLADRLLELDAGQLTQRSVASAAANVVSPHKPAAASGISLGFAAGGEG
ncbi:MAG: cyclic peptide export ABC transporter [Polyangiales bacterium]